MNRRIVSLKPGWHGSFGDLVTTGGVVDLHNEGDLACIQYDPLGFVSLKWMSNQSFPMRIDDGCFLDSLEIRFSGVTQFSLEPRDPGKPLEADRDLLDLVVLDTSEDSCSVLFVFVGGMKVLVTARTCAIELVEKGLSTLSLPPGRGR